MKRPSDDEVDRWFESMNEWKKAGVVLLALVLTPLVICAEGAERAYELIYEFARPKPKPTEPY